MRVAGLNPQTAHIFSLSLLIMASGIIYLLIVGMWVAYFIPRWVHSHDEFSGKSIERYKSALRTVAGSGNGREGYAAQVREKVDAMKAKLRNALRAMEFA